MLKFHPSLLLCRFVHSTNPAAEAAKAAAAAERPKLRGRGHKEVEHPYLDPVFPAELRPRFKRPTSYAPPNPNPPLKNIRPGPSSGSTNTSFNMSEVPRRYGSTKTVRVNSKQREKKKKKKNVNQSDRQSNQQQTNQQQPFQYPWHQPYGPLNSIPLVAHTPAQGPINPLSDMPHRTPPGSLPSLKSLVPVFRKSLSPDELSLPPLRVGSQSLPYKLSPAGPPPQPVHPADAPVVRPPPPP